MKPESHSPGVGAQGKRKLHALATGVTPNNSDRPPGVGELKSNYSSSTKGVSAVVEVGLHIGTLFPIIIVYRGILSQH